MLRYRFTGETIFVRPEGLKVGEVAKQTGLSVRTLHYYDEIGLLHPGQITAARHRLYGAPELARLQQIKSLRQLGFALGEIRELLDAPRFSPENVIRMHVQRLRDQIEQQTRLVALLENIGAAYAAGTAASPDEFICAIEGITLLEKTLTPDEIAEIKERGDRFGVEHVRAVEAEWPVLIDKVRDEMRLGTDPANERVRPLAARWRELVAEFTGNNPSIEKKLRAAYASDEMMLERTGIDREIFSYMHRAIRAL